MPIFGNGFIPFPDPKQTFVMLILIYLNVLPFGFSFFSFPSQAGVVILPGRNRRRSTLQILFSIFPYAIFVPSSGTVRLYLLRYCLLAYAVAWSIVMAIVLSLNAFLYSY